MKTHNWYTRFINSRFFLFSCLFHALVIIVIGTRVLIDRAAPPEDFIGEIEPGEITKFPDPSPSPVQTGQSKDPYTPENNAKLAVEAITSTRIETDPAHTFALTPVVPVTPSGIGSPDVTSTPAPFRNELPKELAREIQQLRNYRVPTTSRTNPTYAFTVFLAKYSGGDWNSTVQIRDNQIVKGSLPNLLWIAQKLSRDRIKGTPAAEPLDLASDALFAKRPPFVLLTGHRDFKLTETEVTNLQKYIRLGGCIWGDSSLPGERSRFDLAFRREMKRIVPDLDKDFEPLSSKDPLFHSGFYPNVISAPAGMNGYRLPVQVLRYYGRICVLYTPNDYADLWQFGLTDRWEFETSRDANYQMVAMNENLWRKRETYFHGVTPETAKAAYQFGLNVIAHLVTQWEQNPPRFTGGL